MKFSLKYNEYCRLDLDAWIHEPNLEEEVNEPENESAFANSALRSEFIGFGGPPRYSSDEDREYGKNLSKTKEKKDELSEEELQKVCSFLKNNLRLISVE